MTPTSADAVAIMKGRTLKGSPSGVSCRFVQINEEWGLKLYQDKGNRTDCYEWQKRAAEHGLGPQVGDIVELPGGEDGFDHGYITQVAELIFEPYTGGPTPEGYYHRFDEVTKQVRPEMLMLKDELLKIGFYFVDDHIQNVGRINGKLVCIDFEYR